jgi:Lrp/AsnC family transcriptional regulator, regulator of ectoine-degradation genes
MARKASASTPPRSRRRKSSLSERRSLDGRIALDKIDLQIMSILQKDGRISKADLAVQVHLSPSACHERLRRLEKQKAILSYHANVNLKAIAHLQVFLVEITLKTHHAYDFRRFESYVANVPQVVECYAVGGGIDYVAKIVAIDVEDYQMLVDRLLEAEVGIDRYFTYVVTKSVKSLPQYAIDNFLTDN